MKVYVAGSYQAEKAIQMLGSIIRDMGFDVYVFCDTGEPAHDISVKIREEHLPVTWTPKTALDHPLVREIYVRDMDKLYVADLVVLVLPCGKSAHMEAGWIKGKGRHAICYGEMHIGEWDAMYGMFNAIFDITETEAMLVWIRELEAKLKR